LNGLRFARILASVALLGGAYLAIRLAWADHLSRATEAGVRERGARLWPGAQAYLRLAELRESRGGDPLPELRRAAAFEPENPELQQRLGLRAELAGDLALAESCLLRAARYSRLYQPRYLLAQYYFRRRNPAAFDRWFAEALDIAWGNVGPLLELWSRTHHDPAELARIGTAQRAPVAREFLLYLNEHGERDAAASVARRLARSPAAEDVPVLLPFLDDSLGEGRVEPAREIWNALSSARLIPQPLLDAAKPRFYAFAPLRSVRHGFDWRLESGEDAALAAVGKDLRIRVSGKQADFTMLAWQYVPVAPGTSCFFEFETAALDATPAASIVPALFFRSAAGRWEELGPGKPAPASLLRAAIVYRRLPSAARLAGEFLVHKAHMDCRP
jgi:hypothetical protein